MTSLDIFVLLILSLQIYTCITTENILDLNANLKPFANFLYKKLGHLFSVIVDVPILIAALYLAHSYSRVHLGLLVCISAYYVCEGITNYFIVSDLKPATKK